MTPIDFEAELGKRIFVMRIIVGALLAGIGGFAVVAVVIRLQGNFNPALTTVFSLVGLAYTMAVAVAYFVVPGNIVQSARRRLAQSTSGNSNNEAAEAQSLLRFCAIYQTQLIVSAALVEGTAFLWLIFFLVTGEWIMLGIGLAGALILATKFPTTDGVTRWLMQQKELSEYERGVL